MRPDLDLCRGNPIYPLTGAKTSTVSLLDLPGLPLTLNYSTRKALAADSSTYLGRGLVLQPPAGAGPQWSLNIEREFYFGNPAQIYLGNDKWELLNGNGASPTTGQSLGPDLQVGRSNSVTWYAFDKQKSTAHVLQSNDAGNSTSIATLAGVVDIGGGASYSVKHSTPFAPNDWRPVPQLTQLTDAFGRITTFTYEQPADISQVARLTSIIAPGNQTISLAYNAQGMLATITWPDKTVRSFLYELPGQPWLLTGVTDENNRRDRTYGYDAQGRAVSTQLAGGADSYQVQRWQSPPTPSVKRWYDPVADVIWRETTWNHPQQVDVAGPNGAVSQIKTALVNGVARLTSQSQPAGSGCSASTSSQDYDANGNVVWREDFNGRRTCYANDLGRNVETARVEGLAAGADCTAPLTAASALPAGARKISTQWHPVWRKAAKIAEPGKLTTLVYNGQPDPFNGGAVASCAPSSATLPDGSPIVVLCKQVEQATKDLDGSQGFAAALDASVKTRTRSWTYNQFGQVLTAKGPRTDVDDTTTYAYHASTTINVAGGVNLGVTQGDLQSITAPKNAAGVAQVSQFTEYNPLGQVTRMVDPNGVVTTLSYDLRQRLKTRTVAAGTPQARTTSYDYWPTGLLKSVTFPATTRTTAAGTAGNPQPRSVSYGYDDAHRLTSITRGSGEQLFYTLDNAGNVTREELHNASGATEQVIKRDFDALGRLWHHIQNINGVDQSTEFGYDAQGNPTTTQRPAVASYGESSGPLEVRRYNALNQLTRIEDAVNGGAKPTQLSPDARDLVTQVQAPNGATTGYTIDGLGQTTLETSPDAGSTSNSFDEAGNLKTRTDARGVTRSWTYDALNRPTAMTVRKSGSTDTSEDQAWVWDASPAGAPLACSNGLGRLCKQSDLSGSTYYAYDAFGNLSQRTVVEGGATTTQSFGYDGEDRLASVSAASGKAIALARDSEGRVSAANALVAGASLAVIKSSSFRADGQFSSTQLGNNVSLNRQFDSSGAISAEAETGINTGGGGSGGTVEAPTAPEWAMILLGSWLAWQAARPRLGPRLGLRVSARGRMSPKRLHAPGWLTLLALCMALLAHAPGAQAQAQTQGQETLQLDERGNIKTRSVDGRTSTYLYDKLDRLTTETGKANQSFTLDPNGNRTSDGQATYTVQPNGNRILTRNGQSWLYDPAGNLLQDQTQLNGQSVTRSFSYWMSGMLKTVSINGQLVATYYHNAQNQRTRKVLVNPPTGTPAVTLYRYDPQGQLSEEIAASGPRAGQTLVTYVWRDDTPAALIYAPSTPSNPTGQERIVYLHTDHLGSPRKASDQSARIVWTWESDAFGSTPPNEDPSSTGTKTTINLRLPGQYFDAESGLYYNGNRYYDPRVGRYTQPDPLGLVAGIDPYAYVLGNPVSYTDADGRQVVIVVPGRKSGRFDPDFPPGVGPNSESNSSSTSTTRTAEEERKKTYQTYTRYNPKTGKCYSGRTSGYDDPNTNIKNRAMGQPLLNAEGFLPPVLDRSSDNYSAIRGREQKLIEVNGGAQSSGGSSRNMINGISTWNPRRPFYLNDALVEFGEAIPSGNCTCQ